MRDLYVDASEVLAEMDRLKKLMTTTQFERALYGVLNATGKHVKTILGKDLPQKYQIKANKVKDAVGNPVTRTGGALIGCTIPIKGRRGSIARSGGTYVATGGLPGWESLYRKYRVRAKIVKGKKSVLPKKMSRSDDYGDHPPFINTIARKIGTLTFTRIKEKERLPIRKVVGIAIPQMPMNRSEEDVQRDIRNYLQNRIEHRIQAFIKNGR